MLFSHDLRWRKQRLAAPSTSLAGPFPHLRGDCAQPPDQAGGKARAGPQANCGYSPAAHRVNADRAAAWLALCRKRCKEFLGAVIGPLWIPNAIDRDGRKWVMAIQDMADGCGPRRL